MSPEDVRTLLVTADRIAQTGKLAADSKGRGLGVYQLRQRMLAWMRHRAMVYLMIMSGMRIGEVCGLLWRHVLWDDRAIFITQAYKRKVKDKADRIGDPKTFSSCRHVTLDSETMAILRALYISQNDAKDSHFVFGGDEPMSPVHWTKRAWRDLLAEAGFANDAGKPHWLPHDCRHYHASVLINSGMQIQQVSERLGHANTLVTQTVYAHLFKAMSGLNNRLSADLVSRCLDDERVHRSATVALPAPNRDSHGKHGACMLVWTGIKVALGQDHHLSQAAFGHARSSGLR